jgi:hypothetical protein
MTQYQLTPPVITLPSLIAQERKTARKKVIEKARKLERDSFIAMMRRKSWLLESSEMIE